MVRICLKNTFLSVSCDDDEADETSNDVERLGRRTMKEGDCSNRSRSADCKWPTHFSHWQEEDDELLTPRLEVHNGTSQLAKLNRLLDTPDQSTAEQTEQSEQEDSVQQLDLELLHSPQMETRGDVQNPEAVAEMYSGGFVPLGLPGWQFQEDTSPMPLGLVSRSQLGLNSDAPPFNPSRPLVGETEEVGLQEAVIAIPPTCRVSRVDSSPSMSEDNEEALVLPGHRTCSNSSVSTMADRAEDQADNAVLADFEWAGKQSATARSWSGPFPAGPLTQHRQAAQRAGVGSCRNPSKPGPLPKEYRHGHVPKNLNLEEEYRRTQQNQPPTTLMIRNIPNRYTQRELIAELEDLGFAGTFNFLYLPLDKGTMANVGYSFVNFVEHTWADMCMSAFQGYCFKRHRRHSRKVAAVSVAHIQGLEANLLHYESAAVNTAKLKQRRPVVVANISRQFHRAAAAERGGQLPPPR